MLRRLLLCLLATGCGCGRFDETRVEGPTSTFAVRIASANDDAEELTDGNMDLDSTDLELCDDLTIPRLGQIVGVRFVGVPAPRGARVISATIQFTVGGPPLAGPGMLTLRGERLPSLPINDADFQLSSRQRTISAVDWAPVAWSVAGSAGAEQRTPELAEIVEEILAQPVWTPGSAMMMFITGTGANQANAFDGTPSAAALLQLEYEAAP